MWNMFNGAARRNILGNATIRHERAANCDFSAGAASFDRYLGDWDVSNVKDMNGCLQRLGLRPAPAGAWTRTRNWRALATPVLLDVVRRAGQFVTASSDCNLRPRRRRAPSAASHRRQHPRNRRGWQIRRARGGTATSRRGRHQGDGHGAAVRGRLVLQRGHRRVGHLGVTSFAVCSRAPWPSTRPSAGAWRHGGRSMTPVRSRTRRASRRCWRGRAGRGLLSADAPDAGAANAADGASDDGEPTLAPSTANWFRPCSPGARPVPNSDAAADAGLSSAYHGADDASPDADPDGRPGYFVGDAELVATQFNSAEGLKAAFAVDHRQLGRRLRRRGRCGGRRAAASSTAERRDLVPRRRRPWPATDNAEQSRRNCWGAWTL